MRNVKKGTDRTTEGKISCGYRGQAGADGRRTPDAVRHGGKSNRRGTPTWRKVAQKILQTCNEQPDIHERFMEMCGKVAGRWRTILGSSPEEMDVPIKVDEELYFEGKFDTEAMLNMLEKKVLEPTGVDYSSIKIRYMAKGQEQAKNIEQDVLEHEEQEQHAPVQTM